ncbi:hypothetical protein KC19_5G063600 [Ceratodon purpureus]|uniref:Uncharacterized protein n=1 Tax=Ceratodon purpureus TaxID=3225 RepID=A0A8T0HYH1_CERPU|nr:hypothetical protein KC19_5G063600 [Ceratodon purpureus]
MIAMILRHSFLLFNSAHVCVRHLHEMCIVIWTFVLDLESSSTSGYTFVIFQFHDL